MLKYQKLITKQPNIDASLILMNNYFFKNDLSLSYLAMVYNMTEPTGALDFWLDTFNTMYDKHAPYKQKRVKSVSKPKWFTKELQEAIYLRDFVRKRGQHDKS